MAAVRRWGLATAIAAVLALTGLAALAELAGAARPPETGWWRGANEQGSEVAFAVERVGGERVITSVVEGCQGEGGSFDGMLEWSDVLFFDRESSHPTGAPNAHSAYPIRDSGRLDTRERKIRAPPGSAGYELKLGHEEPAPFKAARLVGGRGQVVLLGHWASSECFHDPAEGERIEVAAVPGGDPVRAGVWRWQGLLPFGDVVDYAAGLFYVQPSGVLGSAKGMFLGPSTPPPDRKPNPLYSPWPVPCFSQNVAPTLLGTGSMEYDFREGFMIETAAIPPDASLHTAGGKSPGSLAWVQTDGAFGSPTRYDGAYLIDEQVPLIGAPSWCLDIPIPFEASWVRGPAPTVLGSLKRGPRIPRPPGGILPVPSEPTEYVALGDSYSSGEGVPPFDADTDSATNRCHRSTGAYSRVFSIPGYRLNRSFFACSGAITDNVGRLDAAGALLGTPQAGEPAIQLGRLGADQWAATDLVTLTIGGNDAQFANVLKTCVIRACHKGKFADQIKARIANEVPPVLASAYGAIRSHAVDASVLVLGYPQLFPDDPRPRCPIGKRVVSRPKQVFLRERGEQLNAVIRAQAAAAGFHFVGVERTFSGHEPCGRRDEWIHALVLRGGGPVFSFHPNQKGQRAYAQRLVGYFDCLAGQDYPFLASGVPEHPTPVRPVPRQCD